MVKVDTKQNTKSQPGQPGSVKPVTMVSAKGVAPASHPGGNLGAWLHPARKGRKA